MPASPDQFVGSWRLLKWIITDDAGTVREPMGSDIKGLIIYSADGWMSAMLGHRERARFRFAQMTTPIIEPLSSGRQGEHSAPSLKAAQSWPLMHEGPILYEDPGDSRQCR